MRSFSIIFAPPMSRRKLAETPEQVKERRLFAVLVRSLRACAGWSQKELAQQLGISPASIAKLETGELRINADKKEELLQLFKKTGVNFVYSPISISIVVDEKLISRLDQSTTLTAPIEGF